MRTFPGWSRLRITTFARCHFDEVHPLILRSAMYLKTCTADVSSEAIPNEEFLLHARAARKDSAVHVSLSSDSLFKQPGDHGDPPLREAGEPAKLVHPRTIGCRFTVPVRSFRGAQPRRKRTARRWIVYMLRSGALSTRNAHFPWPTRR